MMNKFEKSNCSKSYKLVFGKKLLDRMKEIGEDRMKKVITYGTFDLFHVGHLNIIKTS